MVVVTGYVIRAYRRGRPTYLPRPDAFRVGQRAKRGDALVIQDLGMAEAACAEANDLLRDVIVQRFLEKTGMRPADGLVEQLFNAAKWEVVSA